MPAVESVAIGIPVRSRSGGSAPPGLHRTGLIRTGLNQTGLNQTLEALHATAAGARIVLIDHGADGETSALLADLPYMRCSTSGEDKATGGGQGGGASCFNRLIRAVPAEVYILLECGALPASGWIERLLETFRRVPSCGLTGPSTNRSWNEQRVGPLGAESRAPQAHPARAVERRFGSTYRSLQPLHSLADFCYAVRREVIDAIGEADEGYGTGPCWEMDYSIRAFRAGFLGLWTCGAYVHRAHDEAFDPAAFTRSKQRYQDKFCGLHLKGKKTDYRNHCRGEACAHFAPASLISLTVLDQQRPSAVPVASAVTASPIPLPRLSPALPLVSCIMPTGDRRRFIPAALRAFQQQDYPHLELIVVDGGTDPIDDLLPADPRIRYIRAGARSSGSQPRRLTVGALRNLACEHARGHFIAHWDDDDWHAPSRIRIQVERTVERSYQLCGTSTLFYVDPRLQTAFRYAYRGATSAWMGALFYTRETWARHRFADVQVGEDVRFIARIPNAQRLDLLDLELTVCTLHEANVSPKKTNGIFWSTVPLEQVTALLEKHQQGATGDMPEPTLSAQDGQPVAEDAGTSPASGWAPNRALPSVPAGCQQEGSRQPLISCIMPTCDRRTFVALALEAFAAQTYPNRELLVIDDGADSVEDLCTSYPRVRYRRLHHKLTLGEKRNLACELAQGALIAHWDDDDWYGPERLACQAAPIHHNAADMTGMVNQHALELPEAQFWQISGELHRRMFVGNLHGGTLMFRKALFDQGVRYPAANIAEDAALVRQFARRGQRILPLAHTGHFLYMRHERNTWKFKPGTFLDPRGWQRVPRPACFPAELVEQYQHAQYQQAQDRGMVSSSAVPLLPSHA